MDVRLDKQVAIVTGGDSGLGKGIALLFAEAGASIAVNFHEQQEDAENVVAEIKKNGGQAFAIKGDVGKADDVDRIFSETVKRFGGIDILAANSGIQKDAKVGDMTLKQWQAVIETNLTGQFLCAQAAIRQFRAQGDRGVSRARGKILHMSSVHDVIPWAGHANYAASKGGISMLMKTLAQEVAPEGIRINAISPDAIKTRINKEATEGDAAGKLLKLIPSRRIGEPADVARVALFLASDMADYMVGATVYVDGGMTLYPGFEDNG
jgi:glucose 1-dehydrogenase